MCLLANVFLHYYYACALILSMLQYASSRLNASSVPTSMKNCNLEKYTFMKPSQSISQSFPAVMLIIFDRILENNPYGCILHIKYLVLKSSLKIYFFIPLWFHYSKDTLNYKNNL